MFELKLQQNLVSLYNGENYRLKNGGDIVINIESKRHLDKIDIYRKKLEKMIDEKNMKSDAETVKLSQKLDKLIVNYYKKSSDSEEK